MTTPTKDALLQAAEVLDMAAIDFAGRPSLQSVATLLRTMAEGGGDADFDQACTDLRCLAILDDPHDPEKAAATRRALARIRALPQLERRCEELESWKKTFEPVYLRLFLQHLRTVQAARRVSAQLRDERRLYARAYDRFEADLAAERELRKEKNP